MMIRRFCSQVWLYAKAQQGGFDFAELIAFKVIYSLLTLVFYCLVAGFAMGQADLTHWVVGNAFLLCLFESVLMIGTTFASERYNGRLRSIVVAPESKLAVMLQNGVASILITFLTIVVGTAAGGLIFGVDFSGLNIPAFMLCVLVATFACAGVGLFLAVFALISDSMYLVLNLVASLTIIFSGANFPVSQLPEFAQWIAKIFPLRLSIQAADLCFGRIDGAFYKSLGGELLLGLIYYIAAFALLKIIERIAVKKATLEIF